MGTRIVASVLRDSHSSQSLRASSPSSRRLARLSLVSCLVLILSLLQWNMMEKCHGPSSACRKAENGLVVMAFRQQHPRKQRWKPRRQEQPLLNNCNPRQSSASRSPLTSTSVFFSNNYNTVNIIKNGRRHLGKSHLMKQRYHTNFRTNNIHNPLFGGTSDAGDNNNNNNNDDGKINRKRINSMKRIGGRAIGKSSPPPPPPPPSSITEPQKNKFPSANSLVVALLVLAVLKSIFFGGGGGDSEYSYYSYSYSSSSSYETRINPDGSRTTEETSRNERSDLKTNIPGFGRNNRDAVEDNRSGGDFFYLED